MESALSPNTAAFLQYLSSQLGGDNNNTGNDTSGTDSGNAALASGAEAALPPSAFFQIPNTSSNANNLPTPASKSSSPPDIKPQTLSASEGDSPLDSAPAVAAATGTDGHHKRKAGLHHTVVEDEEDDETDSDAVSGHEDKRQHQNTKSGKKGGRKSSASGTGADDGTPSKPGKEMSKAARRKEQNRAAQKAFRERREARVNDLEAKVAELEAKSYSSTVENENLRSILKRLQEENVSLKQSAFTFAMPRAGSGSASNTSPINGNVNGSPLHRVNSKPPTPPEEPLKTIYDSAPRVNTNTGAQRPPHRQSSSGMAASPESLNSATSASSSSRNPLLNGNSPMRFDSFSNFSSTDTGLTPPSVASDNKSDLEALWASFYPPNNVTGGNALPQQQQQQMPNGDRTAPQPALASPNPLTQFLAAQLAQGKSWPQQQQQYQPQQQQQTSSAPAPAPNMAYRDQTQAAAPPAQDFDWSNMNNTSIDDFLASLTGSNGGSGSMDDNPVSATDDDLFNQQLQQILAGGAYDNTSINSMLNVGSDSGSSKAFSPTNYLNMSPSPLNSLSNSASPQSAQVSGASTSASPASSVQPKELSPDFAAQSNSIAKKTNGGHACGEIVNVVDANGNIIKPSDLWVKMGMQHQDNVDNLLIDDLCDQMKAKAKCTDNGTQLTMDDLNHMMKYDGGAQQQKRVDELKDKWGWGQVFGK